jgi:hypothetical protein
VFDQLVISGTADLAGELYVHVLLGGQPAAGDVYKIVGCSHLVGGFTGLTSFTPQNWTVMYDDTGATLRADA